MKIKLTEEIKMGKKAMQIKTGQPVYLWD